MTRDEIIAARVRAAAIVEDAGLVIVPREALCWINELISALNQDDRNVITQDMLSKMHCRALHDAMIEAAQS